ncbi:MAG: SURF1 family protein [Pseudomonadota bacterium]
MTEARRRGFLVPTLATLIGLAILIGLGTWQMERRAWKHALIETIDARLAAPPVDVPATLATPEDWEFRKVRVRGRFLHDKERHVYRVGPQGGAGYQVFTPLAREDGAILMVDRGWVAQEAKDPATRQQGQIAGLIAVTGVLRLAEKPPRFSTSAVGDGEKNIYYRATPAYLATEVGLAAPDYYVAVDPASSPAGGPQGRLPGARLADNHLQYALTWYGLAVALMGVYAVLWRRHRRAATARNK